jgi:hypothetical protein
MIFSWLFKGKDKKILTKSTSRKECSEEALLRKAYRVGRYSPTNCECPPAPDIIPVWIQNNVQALEIYVDRLFEEYVVPTEVEPWIYVSMYRGFRDLVLSHHDQEDSPFCLSSEETIRISKQIFITLAKIRGHVINIDC